MSKRMRVPVTMRAVVQRINRKLKADAEVVKVPRGERMLQELGQYYILNVKRNYVAVKNIDPEEYARDLGVLKEWEEVRENYTR